MTDKLLLTQSGEYPMYSSHMLEKMLRLCEEEGYQNSSCYQGDYNLITRGMESKLLSLLRDHGMTFNAFRWVPGGLFYKID